jgi:quercetin dioxygenase-like cupin family protein
MSGTRTSFVFGVIVGAAIVSAGGAAVSLVASGSSSWPAVQAEPAPAMKYTSKIVLENDRVRVKDVTFPAGVADTGMHTHELPHVGVILTAGALTFTEPGKPPETVKFDVGSVGFREANARHSVASAIKGPMRVIEVELKK